MVCGFPTVFDEAFDRVKQESRGPIIDRCPLSLAGKLKYAYPLSRSQNNPLSKAGESRATKKGLLLNSNYIIMDLSKLKSMRWNSKKRRFPLVFRFFTHGFAIEQIHDR
jgi:hypothetical protein